VDQQDGVEGSTLELYRSLLRLRRERALGTGGLALVEGFADDVVALENRDPEGQHSTLVVANLGSEPVALPDGLTVLIASGPLTAEGLVPEDTTVWATR
jgi:alpha-glucosidase